MEMKRKNGAKYLLLTPGNYGADFVKENTKLDVESSMKCSNYVGETLDMAVELGFLGVLFVGTHREIRQGFRWHYEHAFQTFRCKGRADVCTCPAIRS